MKQVNQLTVSVLSPWGVNDGDALSNAKKLFSHIRNLFSFGEKLVADSKHFPVANKLIAQ